MKQAINLNNLKNENLQNINFDDTNFAWQDVANISEISFELLLPNSNLKKKPESTDQNYFENNILMTEDTHMRQNLLNLAMQENTIIKANKDDDVNLLVKAKNNHYTKSFKFNLPKMTQDDIKFFELLASQKNININNENSIIVEEGGKTEVLKNLKFSRSFLELLEYSLKSQRPIRIDFGQNSAVILRINKQGKVSAEFISSDKVMEHLLKTNIPQLKKKLDSSGIKYRKIYYRDEEE